jgi:hydrogenase nickel incorporation protein HypA/HybF
VILTIGELAGIENDALYFAWDVVVKDNIANGSKLIIEEVPGEAKCNSCGHIFRTSDYFTVCEKCGDFKTEIVKGKELQVRSIEVDDGKIG